MCADNRNGECPMHGPLHSLRRLVGTSSTAAPVTLPDVPDWLRDLPREVRLPVWLTLCLFIWLPTILQFFYMGFIIVIYYYGALNNLYSVNNEIKSAHIMFSPKLLY